VSAFDATVTIRRRRFASEDTGFAVIDAAMDDGTALVLVGPLIHLEERERARVIGGWVTDARYGPQVKVSEAHPLPPSDEEAVLAYLRRIRHVGSRRASALVSAYGAEGAIEVIDRDPSGAFAAVGLRGVAAAEAVLSWDELRGMRRLHLLLAPHGLGYLVTRVHDAYGDGAARIVAESPYELTSVFGVGFQIADRIARVNGITLDDPARARAGVVHLLSEAERDGSTCMPFDALLAGLRALISAEAVSLLPPGFMVGLVERGDIRIVEDWVYRLETFALESELAERVAALLDGSVGRRFENAVVDVDDGLTEEQRSAVEAAVSRRLSLVTGGPGTGKTASIKSIASVAAGLGARVMLVAPTGRAAIRMTESTGFAASTVHSALGWIPGEGPEMDELRPLSCDLLIVDECSMANLELLVTLLRAVGASTHVVLVGDADQLAPVGAGKPFAELVASESVPAARLTHIFRQAAGSMIVQGAHAIRRGASPSFVCEEGMRRDLFLISQPDAAAAVAEVVGLVSSRLPSHYGVDPVRDIQVFAPVYRGEVGIDALNTALRAALNPDGAPVRGGRFRVGDKVMMSGRNLHELGLMNGTVLTVLDEIGSGDSGDADALLLAGEESVFRLPAEEAGSLTLAYACSVHKGQGIELPIAVIVAHPAAGAYFLRREMLYTAITRAKVATVIVGTAAVVARAARTADTGRRHSRLAEQLALLVD
jgi:exodeoxyribonuclease V alpha subunit